MKMILPRRIITATINEILKEVKRNEQLCRDAWDAYLG